jgi:hypothetical protein
MLSKKMYFIVTCMGNNNNISGIQMIILHLITKIQYAHIPSN